MSTKYLHEIKRGSAASLLAGLKSESGEASVSAGLRLVQDAASFGVSIRDYLTLAVNPMEGDTKYVGLNGYEAALAYLNLPFKNDYEQGVILQAASETFQRFPGTRAMFPEVIDDMLRWANRQDVIESTAPFIAVSRTINGTELISTVVNDDSAARTTSTIAEGTNIPVRSIRTSQTSVGIFKHGSGYRTTYEFIRRVALDILTPFANRVQRELELSKVTAAVNMLISGDGVNAAASEINQMSLTDYYDATSGVAGKLQYRPLLKWLTDRAKAGVPVDTVIGNYDAYLQWLFLFSPVLNMKSEVQAMSEAGLTPKFNVAVPVLNGTVSFALASAAPAGKLIGITKGETLEELVEAGSNIAESETSIKNQTVTYVKTQNVGYKLAFGDTRQLYDYAQTS
jgi:hypothetical protein